MTAFSDLPSALVKDIVLRILTQEQQSSISDVALVCRPWHSIVSENLAQILIHKCNGDLPEALSLALRHNQLRAFDVAIELVSISTSLDDSNQALMLVSQHGRPGLAQLLLTAPHHAAHADCENGQALVTAASRGHRKVVQMLLDAPQHAARADCRDGAALVIAAECGHPEADCQDGQALVDAAEEGHSEIVQMLLGAPENAPHADCQDGLALVDAASRGHREILKMDNY
eukprot:gene4684-biopygen8812